MRRIHLVAAVVLVTASWLAIGAGGDHFARGSAHAPSGQQTARVVAVLDGDTIVVQSAAGQQRVRLLGIDAPELEHPGQRRQCFGEEATRALRRLTPPGAQVVLASDPVADDRDHYGRLLRYVGIDGEDVGQVLVSQGYARARPSTPRVTRADGYVASAAAARRDRRGLWAACPHT